MILFSSDDSTTTIVFSVEVVASLPRSYVHGHVGGSLFRGDMKFQTLNNRPT
jgi:hypothetical protein